MTAAGRETCAAPSADASPPEARPPSPRRRPLHPARRVLLWVGFVALAASLLVTMWWGRPGLVMEAAAIFCIMAAIPWGRS